MLSTDLQLLSGNSIKVATSVAVVALTLILLRRIRACNHCKIPQARGGSPIIGHALAYKSNPASFLLQQVLTVGSIFRINLAGRRMVVLCGGASHDEMQQVKVCMTLPERICSARDAVADIGFEYTLGKANVYQGTDFHKRLIKHYLKDDATVPLLFTALQDAYRLEIDKQIIAKDAHGDKDNKLMVKDLFALVRRCTIRAVVSVFLGSALLESSDAFLDDFMVLQDDIEEATAAAAVLPKFISIPLILRSVERARIKFQNDIAQHILDAQKMPETQQGPWLKEFRTQGVTVEKAAEFIVGLLFAAHKNPAIGSTQSYLYLMLEGTDQERLEIQKEAALFCAKPTSKTLGN